MLIRPELQALRSDDAPQRLVQARLREVTQRWHESSGLVVAEAELSRFASGAALENLPFLATLFTPGDPSAAELVVGLVAVQIAELSAQPLGQVTWRHFTDDALSSLILARCDTTTLSLQAFDGAGYAKTQAAEAVSFSPGETWEHVLAGSAQAELVRIAHERPGGADLSREALQLAPGLVTYRNCAREAQIFRRISNSLVSLKLQRRVGRGEVARQYLLADGTLVHQAAGTPRDSRLELTAALLGRMERTDAAPLLAAMAEEEAGTSLRWQTLRECLALDSATGFATLCRLAARADDPLAGPAGALRAQLLESYPQLAAYQDGARRCPA